MTADDCIVSMSQYNIRLPPELISVIKADANAHNTTASRTIRKILNDHYGITIRDNNGRARPPR